MVTIDSDKCNGCTVCNWVCPHGVLTMYSKKAVVSHPDRCIECGACSLNCVPKAITVTKGTGCLYIIIKEDILRIKGKNSCC